ncbi:Inosose dehydratase [Streptomyces fumanus]
MGPYGYLPTDPARLTDEVDRRGLNRKVSAGTVFCGLHRGPAAWDAVREQVGRVASLTQAMGARHLVVIPSFWRDDKTAEILEPPELTREQWAHLTEGMARLGREVRDTYGLDIVVHPHADTHLDTEEHVERFLDATDPDLVSLCLDTGHYAYCGGDSVRLIETYGERIGYLHLKQVDPAVLADVREQGLPFGPAVRRGVMCEPPGGVPALEPVLAAAQRLGVDLFAIVEQDMYPCARTGRCPSRYAPAGSCAPAGPDPAAGRLRPAAPPPPAPDGARAATARTPPRSSPPPAPPRSGTARAGPRRRPR